MPDHPEILIASSINSYSSKDSFIIKLPKGIHSKAELLSELNIRLLFPAYFGFNWDALYDCLLDLSWIVERDVVIIHEDLPSLAEKELKKYIDLLVDACSVWKNADEHNLFVMFPAAISDKIREIVKSQG